MKTNEEWKEISRWYEFSIRMLGTFKPEWHEVARTASWENAKDIINTLGKAKEDKFYVVIKCTLVGKEGREKPALWYPSEGSVRAAMKQGVSDVGRSQ